MCKILDKVYEDRVKFEEQNLQNMFNKHYWCCDCGEEFSYDTPAPPPKEDIEWSDGHTCTPIKVVANWTTKVEYSNNYDY